MKNTLSTAITAFLLVSCTNDSGYSARTVQTKQVNNPGSGDINEVGAQNQTENTIEEISQEVKESAPEITASPARLRLLNGQELQETYFKVTGLKMASDFENADMTSGYDTGANGLVGDALFLKVLQNLEDLAKQYVEENSKTEFPCLLNPDEACIQKFIKELGIKAFRRELTQTETDEIATDYTKQKAIEGATEQEALTFLTIRILGSANTLYRNELSNSLEGNDKAQFISYSLTGLPPDSELLDTAKKGELVDVGLSSQLDRLLLSSEFKSRLTAFIRQWLDLNDLLRMEKNPENFPKFENAELPKALRAEFDSYVEDVFFTKQGNLKSLLSSDTTFINQHTAPLYSVTANGDNLQSHKMNPQRRKGILTLASTMSVHGIEDQTDIDKPVDKAVMISERMLCRVVGLPSGIDIGMALDNVKENINDFENLTTRKKMEAAMQQDQSCIACHEQFMPYGYMLSHYGSLGQYMETFNSSPLDASVEKAFLDGGVKPYDSILKFIDDLENSQQIQNCFAKNLAQFFSGNFEGEHVKSFEEYFIHFLKADNSLIATIKSLYMEENFYKRIAK